MLNPVKPETLHKILCIIFDGKPRSFDDISAETGVSRETVYRAMDGLCRNGKAHIQYFDYERAQKGIAMWVYGFGFNASRKTESKLSSSQRMKAYRARIAEQQRTERLKRELTQPVFRHWMDEALYGPAQPVANAIPCTVRVFKQDMTISENEMEEIA